MVHDYAVKFIDVFLLLKERQLFRKNSFQRFVSDWDFEKFGKERQESTEAKK